MLRDNWFNVCLYLVSYCAKLAILNTPRLWFLLGVVFFKDSFTQLYQNLNTLLGSIFTLILGGLSTLTTGPYYKYNFI